MAVKAEDGKVLEQSSLKYTSQLGVWANGAVIAGVAFLLSWIVLFFTIGLFDKSGGSYSGFARIVSDLTHYSLTIAGLVFAGFVGIGINLFRKATALDSWQPISPAKLVERFSKMHR